MNALIIEDETEAAEWLTNLISLCDPSINVISIIDSVQDAVGYFNSGKSADLVFMDIQLADGKSFEIFDQSVVEAPIIFTTAYDEFALQAFKQHSIDYLLKPIQREELSQAIGKLKKVYPPGVQLTSEEILELKSIVSSATTKYKQRLLIKSGNKLQYKQTRSVCYFFADGKTTYLVGQGDGKRFIVDHTLEELETILDPTQFYRISRKFIVNVDCVMELKGLLSSKVELRLNQPCDHQLSVSRERIQGFKKWLDR